MKSKMMHFMGISRAFHRLILKFHGHFTLKFHDVFMGFSSKQTQRSTYSGKPDLVRRRNACWPVTYQGRTARSHYCLLYDKVFPGLDFGNWDD